MSLKLEKIKKKILYTESEVKFPSKRIQTIRNNKILFKRLHIYRQIDHLGAEIILFVLEQNNKNIDVYNKLIYERFCFNSEKVVKTRIDKYVELKLLKKINECHNCHELYTRIPQFCKKCSERLIRQEIQANKRIQLPHFLLKVDEKGGDFLRIRSSESRKFYLNTIRELGEF